MGLKQEKKRFKSQRGYCTVPGQLNYTIPSQLNHINDDPYVYAGNNPST